MDWSRKSGSVGQSDGAALTQKVTELPDNGRQEHSYEERRRGKEEIISAGRDRRGGGWGS